MQSQDHPRIQAAKDLLESWLEDAFVSTSDDCSRKLDESDPVPLDLIRPDPIKEWRKKSLECIKRGFKRLFSVIRSLEEDATDSPADIAKRLTWEAIDKAFNWKEGERNDPSRFKDWLTRANLLGVGVSLDPAWGAQLVCYFRTEFERLLKQLRNDAFSNTPTAQSKKPPACSDSSPNGMQSGFAHGDDYRTIIVSDKHYTLTPNQARMIRVLHEAFLNEMIGVSTGKLLASINAPHSHVRDSFKSGNGPKIWKSLIKTVAKGMYALQLPPQ